MIFRFTIISDEVEDFVRIIELNSDATFMDLHDEILKSVQFQKGEMTSFFTCNDDWEKEQEITMIEMDFGSEYDNYVMSETPLEDLLEDEKQRLLFTFDMLSDRSFFMELTEIIPTESLKNSVCTHAEGNPPNQFLEDLLPPTTTPKTEQPTLDDEFYGDDIDDVDMDNYSTDTLL